MKSLVLLSLMFLAPLAVSAQSLKVGISSLDITPPVGVPLAGYGGGHRRSLPPDWGNDSPFAHYFRPSEGKRDPIRAKTLYLEKDGKKLVFISLDVVGVTADVRDDLLKKIKYLGIGENELFISATHTHSGPGTLSRNPLWQLLAMDKFQSMIYQAVLNDLMYSVQAAVMRARPAELFTTSFETQGLQKNRRDPSRGTDTTANLLLARDLNGQWLGGIVNYSIHATSFGTGNLHYSADIAGEIEKRLRMEFDSKNTNAAYGSIFLFINGSEGDVSPYKAGVGRMKEIANSFIEQGQQAFSNPRKIEPTWEVKSHVVYLEHPTFNLAGCINTPDLSETERIRRLRVPLMKVVSNKAPIWTVQLGELLFMTWPGEPNTSLGRMLKAQAREKGFDNAWVFGLTNDHLSYFTSEDEYHEGGYESCASFYGSRGGEKIVDAHKNLL